jgi:DNA-binding beta-propeller fold protein YncE
MSKHTILRRTLRLIPIVTITCGGLGAALAAPPFLPSLINSSAIPANGDQNPYGIAFVPQGFPTPAKVAAGDVLVANFNNGTTQTGGNVQGTGTTIVQLHPNGVVAPPNTAKVFFTSKLPGLDTALGVARAGFVFVGNLPTPDGTLASSGPGAVQVIDRFGNWVTSFTDPSEKFINGPWDMAIDDQGAMLHIFISNVRNGTVARLDVSASESGVKLLSETTIAHGYPVVPSAAAVVLGPTGLAYDEATGTLYVASTANNTIYAIANASFANTSVNLGMTVFSDPHLRGPLGLRLAPNGNLLTANGDATPNANPAFPSEIIEFTKAGQFIRQFDVDASQGGAFGLDTVLSTGVSTSPYNIAWVDDVTGNITVTHLP